MSTKVRFAPASVILSISRVWRLLDHGQRPMLASDIGLNVIDPRDAEIARLKAHVAHLSKVAMSKILPGLLDEDETKALVDFVEHLRTKGKTDV